MVDTYSYLVAAFQRDATTGSLMEVPGSPFATGPYPDAVRVSPNGAFAYVANTGDNTISAFVIDAVTGVLTPVPGSPFAVPNGAQALAIDPSGRVAYVLASDRRLQTFAIDAVTGALTSGAATTWSTGGYPRELALAVSRTAAGATLTGLQVVPTSPTQVTSLVGTAQQLQVVGTYSDGTSQFLTASATWASSDPAVATVSNVAGARGGRPAPVTERRR